MIASEQRYAELGRFFHHARSQTTAKIGRRPAREALARDRVANQQRLGEMITQEVHMANFIPLENKSSEVQAGGTPRGTPLSLSESFGNTRSGATANSIEALLSTREASEILKIHPKVLERMAKRGDVPALKVGKFWRYRASALDAWIDSRLKLSRQPCRIETHF